VHDCKIFEEDDFAIANIPFIFRMMPLLTELELFLTGQLQRCRAYGAGTNSPRQTL
jgi:hypothetical protein